MEIHELLRPIAQGLLTPRLMSHDGGPTDQQGRILEAIVKSPVPLRVSGLRVLAGTREGSDPSRQDELREKTIRKQLAMMRQSRNLFSREWFVERRLPTLCLNSYKRGRQSFHFLDVPGKSKQEIETIVPKLREHLEKELGQSHFPEGDTLVQDYRKKIVSNWKSLWFSHLDPAETSAPFLQRTAVPSNDLARRRHAGPEPLTKLICEERAFVLLGDPGSGKSYSVAELAMECAQGNLLGEYFPIYSSLSLFCGEEGLPGLCREAVRRVLGARAVWYSGDVYEDVVRSGMKILHILDALDEVQASQKPVLQAELSSFLQVDNHRVVLTCRRYAYLAEFGQTPTFYLTPLSQSQIAEYLRYFIAGDVEAVFRSQIESNPRIYEMATDPFMLGKMAFLLYADPIHKLPANRGQLLNRFISDLPLYKAKETGRRLAAGFHGNKNVCLEIVAYDMLDKGRVGRDYAYEEAQKAVQGEEFVSHMDALLEQAFRDRFLERGGFLYPKTEISFSHEIFKEAFAARRMKTLMEGGTEQEKERMFLAHMEEVKWDGVFVLLVGMLDKADCDLCMRLLVAYAPALAARCFRAASRTERRLETRLIVNLKNRYIRYRPTGLRELLRQVGTEMAASAESHYFPTVRQGSTVSEETESEKLSRHEAVRLLLKAYSKLEKEYANSAGRENNLSQRIRIFRKLVTLGSEPALDPFLALLTDVAVSSWQRCSLLDLIIEFGRAEIIAKSIIALRNAGFSIECESYEPFAEILVPLPNTRRRLIPSALLALSEAVVPCATTSGENSPAQSVHLPQSSRERLLNKLVSEKYGCIVGLFSSDSHAKQNAAAYALYISAKPAHAQDLRYWLERVTSSAAKILIAGALYKTALVAELSFSSVLRKALRDGDRQEKALAITLLSEVNTRESRILLIDTLQSTEMDSRDKTRVLFLLGGAKNSMECSALMRLFETCRDSSVQADIVESLRGSDCPDVVAPLLRILRTGWKEERCRIWHRLSRAPCVEVFEQLGRDLKDTTPELQHVGLPNLLRGMYAPLEQLTKALRNSKEAVRAKGIEIVERILEGSLVEMLFGLKKLREPESLYRWVGQWLGTVAASKWTADAGEGEEVMQEAVRRLSDMELAAFADEVEQLTGRRFLTFFNEKLMRPKIAD